MKRALFFCLLVVPSFVYSQDEDSVRAEQYFVLFVENEYGDSLKARKYADSGLILAKKVNSTYLLAIAYQMRGWFLQNTSQFSEANDSFFNSLKYFKKLGSKQGIADSYGNIGNSYLDLNNYSKSLDYQFLSLEKNEEILNDKAEGSNLENAKEGKTFALHNIAGIYLEVKLYRLALEYEFRSLEYEMEAGHEVDLAISYNLLGKIHKSLNQKDSAIFYFKKAIEIYKVNSYPYGYSSVLHSYSLLDSVGITENHRNKMLAEALSIRKEFGDMDAEARILLDVAKLQLSTLSGDSLKKILSRVDFLIKENNFESLIWNYHEVLSNYYMKIGLYEKAFKSLMISIEQKEIFQKREERQNLATREIRKQIETKSFNDSLKVQNEFAAERLAHQEELSKKQNVIYLSVIGFIVLVASLLFFIQANKRRKRLNSVLTTKNDLIKQQKEIVDEKNKSISDSINYARRLQSAILPTGEVIKEHLPNSFLVYLPKDIVSGDFYWFHKKNSLTMIAVADCTGHGVPGALVSVVCSGALNRSVKEFELSSPAAILNKTRELVIETFNSDSENVEDGMDISLCVFDEAKKELLFAGANNPLWVVRDSGEKIIADNEISEGDTVMYEIKGDKQPIGHFDHGKDFSERKIPLQQNDSFYLFTDGYADQFGGEKNKKFKSSQMKKTLLEMKTLSFEEQGEKLIDVFTNWKKNEEQVDDVCVIGFKVN